MFCLLLQLLFFSTLCAQMSDVLKPDYAGIEREIKDPESPYNFETLFEKYKSADSTLTIEDKRHLYYGYSFTKEYSPYKRSEAEQKLNDLLQKDNANRKDLEKVLKYTEEILKIYPFSLRMKEYRIYCFKNLKRFKEAAAEEFQVSVIIDAILSSGDGTSKDRCFYIINTINEYELISLLGFEFGGRQTLIENRYDYLTLHDNSYSLDGLYFDVSRCIDTMKF